MYGLPSRGVLMKSRGIRSSRRRGAVAPLVAVMLVVLIGMASFALDGGNMLHARRKLQAAADAAAYAAAADLYIRYPTNSGVDTNGTAKAAALDYANRNGYPNNDSGANANNMSSTPGTSKVTVITYTSADDDGKGAGNYSAGPNAGKPVPKGYVEVTIGYNVPQNFSTVWGYKVQTIRARAVARGAWQSSAIGMMALNPTAAPSLWTSGTGGITTKNGNSIIVNSTSAGDAQVQGTGPITSAAPGKIFVSGPSVVGSGSFTPAPILNSPPQPDPYAYLPAPPMPTTSRTYTSGAVMYPGLYTQTQIQPDMNITLRGEGALNSDGSTIGPGQAIYYFNGGPVQFSSGAFTISSQGGVMIYFNPNPSNMDPGFALTSDTSINLQPMANGPYKGITYFQNRTATAKFQISGNGGITGSGTWYMPKAFAYLSANGAMNVGNLIADTIYVSGNGSIVADQGGPQANTRVIQLVE
jgi:Flp pilus assembly protein TadG